MLTSDKIASTLKILFKRKNYSISMLAERSGVSVNTIKSSLYNKKEYYPGLETLDKLCSGLGVSLEEFFRIAESHHDQELEIDERTRSVLKEIDKQDLDKLIDVLDHLMKQRQEKHV